MRKIFVNILLVCQIGWVLHGGVVINQVQSEPVQKKYSYTYGGFYGLVKIACTTFVESVNRVIELSCDLPVFPEDKTSEKPIQKVQLIFVNSLTNISVRYFSQIEQLKTKMDSVFNFQLSTFNFQLNYMWLLFLFLFLYLQNCFNLRPRGNIDGNISMLKLGNKIPNCLQAYACDQVGIFYFIQNSKILYFKINLIKEVKIL